MIKKYVWGTDKDTEYWDSDVCNSIEECIQDYEYRCQCENEEKVKTILIGEVREYEISFLGERILEQIEEGFYGEFLEYWELREEASSKAIDILEEMLKNIVNEWLDKFNFKAPSFYVENIREVEINQSVTEEIGLNKKGGKLWK